MRRKEGGRAREKEQAAGFLGRNGDRGKGGIESSFSFI
jgi:hypothetical protein